MECLGNTYKYTTATPIRNRLFFTSLRFDFVFFSVIFWRFSVAGAPPIGRVCCDWMRSPRLSVSVLPELEPTHQHPSVLF